METESKRGGMVQMAFPRPTLTGTIVTKDLDHLILMTGLDQAAVVGQITTIVAAEDHLYRVTQEFQSKKYKAGVK